MQVFVCAKICPEPCKRGLKRTIFAQTNDGNTSQISYDMNHRHNLLSSQDLAFDVTFSVQFDFGKCWKRIVSTIKSRQLIIYIYGGQARIFRSFTWFVISVCFGIFDVRTDTNSTCIETTHGNSYSYVQFSKNDERSREAT